MKKLFIVTTIPVSLYFFKGQLRFLSNSFNITAISSQPDLLYKFGKKEGVNVYSIPMKRSISIFWDFFCLVLFIKLFLKDKPYIVHGNTPKAAMLSMLAAKITRVPVRIYMCHGLRYQGARGKMRKLLLVMEKITCSCATKVLCVNKGVKETLEIDNICNHEKSKVVLYGSANGIDLEYFDRSKLDQSISVRKELGINKSDFVFSFVGRIVRDKGINELVHAFNRLTKQHENVHLILVGPEEKKMDPISKESLRIISDNSFIHAVGRKQDVRYYLVASNAFVLPSYREGFGMVLIESGALGIPCITTDIIGCIYCLRPIILAIIPNCLYDYLHKKR